MKVRRFRTSEKYFSRFSGRFISRRPDWNYKQNSVGPSSSFGGPAVWISGITLALTIISITLYAAGKTYRANYLYQFGVTDSILPWATQDLIYLGTVTQLKTLIMVFPIVAIIFTAFIAILWLDYKAGKILADRRKPNAASKINGTGRLDPAAPTRETAFLTLLIMIGLILFVLLFCCLSYVAKAEQLGKQEGKEDRQVIVSGNKEQIRKRNLLYAVALRSLQGQKISETDYAFSCAEKGCFFFQKTAQPENVSGKDVTTATTKFVPLDNLLQFQFIPPE